MEIKFKDLPDHYQVLYATRSNRSELSLLKLGNVKPLYYSNRGYAVEEKQVENQFVRLLGNVKPEYGKTIVEREDGTCWLIQLVCFENYTLYDELITKEDN